MAVCGISFLTSAKKALICPFNSVEEKRRPNVSFVPLEIINQDGFSKANWRTYASSV